MKSKQKKAFEDIVDRLDELDDEITNAYNTLSDIRLNLSFILDDIKDLINNS